MRAPRVNRLIELVDEATLATCIIISGFLSLSLSLSWPRVIYILVEYTPAYDYRYVRADAEFQQFYKSARLRDLEIERERDAETRVVLHRLDY